MNHRFSSIPTENYNMSRSPVHGVDGSNKKQNIWTNQPSATQSRQSHHPGMHVKESIPSIQVISGNLIMTPNMRGSMESQKSGGLNQHPLLPSVDNLKIPSQRY